MRLSREPDGGCPRERGGFYDIYMDSGPEMIDDHAPLSSFTSTARQALVWHLPFMDSMISTLNRGDKVEEIMFPSLQASMLSTLANASVEG
jgi:hypothetical protein